MKFGVKAPDEVDQPQGSDRYIRYFNKDGMYTLRFLEPWEQWTVYWEHYSNKYRCSYPCTANSPDERKDCPGCQLSDSQDEMDQREAKPSKKYLVNAIRTDDEKSEGYVDLWKIPGSLKEDLVLNNSKDKSLSKREYNVIRREKNGRTSYSLDKEDPMPIDLSVFTDKLRDHDAALTEAWENRWDEAKRNENQARRAEAKQAAETKTEAKVDDEPPFEPPASTKGGLSLVKDPEPEPEEEPITITVSSIRQMSAEQLRKLYAQGGFEAPDTDDQAVLAEKLIAALS